MQTNAPPVLKPLYRMPAVVAFSGKKESTIYAAIQAGTFPAPVRIGARGVGWKEEDLLAWRESLAKAGGA